MNDVTHPIPAYYDENGVRREIFAEDLKNDGVFEKAQLMALFDLAEQVQLAPRSSVKGLRHFYEVSGQSTTRRTFVGERDPTHDNDVRTQRCLKIAAPHAWRAVTAFQA